MPQSYANSNSFRQEAHDTIETRCSGGHADALDSSSTSLHLDDGPPKIQEEDGKIHVYYGENWQYQLKQMSQLETDDRVLKPQGHIFLSENVIALYKACSKALSNKKFRLKGPYDCANASVKDGMSRRQFQALPEVEADTFFPYYFENSCPTKGEVVFEKLLPPGSTEQRIVRAVNVKSEGVLTERIPHGTVVYLGGDHGEEQLPLETKEEGGEVSTSPTRKKSTKYVEYRYETPVAGPGDVGYGDWYISSPFPNTWRGGNDGLNVGLAKLRDGHYLYFASDYQPGPGLQVSKLPLTEVPDVPYYLEGRKRWPQPDGENTALAADETALGVIFEGAWVMRGGRLVQRVDEGEYPEGVVERLRGGFFRTCGEHVRVHISRINARIKKAMGSIARYGGEMFGLKAKAGGIIECDIESLATHLRLPEDVLMAFIPQFLSSYMLFRGTVSFLGTKEMEGMFEITKPLPVGPWMRGRVLDTGAGLLFVTSNGKYYSVETKDEVSWLSEYTGPGIGEGRELKLAPCIAASPLENCHLRTYSNRSTSKE